MNLILNEHGMIIVELDDGQTIEKPLGQLVAEFMADAGNTTVMACMTAYLAATAEHCHELYEASGAPEKAFQRIAGIISRESVVMEVMESLRIFIHPDGDLFAAGQAGNKYFEKSCSAIDALKMAAIASDQPELIQFKEFLALLKEIIPEVESVVNQRFRLGRN